MKNFFTISIIVLFNCFLSAQTIIQYETHALLAGEDNPMTICEYTDPGLSGEDVTWDYTYIRKVKPFRGYVRVPSNNIIKGANLELEEFSSRFLFDINKTGIRQLGYLSKNASSKIVYDDPFEKIRFPFKYGDSYSGVYSGAYFYNETLQGEINGSYTVEAESSGTLKLPGANYFNTLRIRTTKNYTLRLSGSDQNVEVTTYRWYNQYHRYPLFVLTAYTTQTGNSTNTSYQAAYNSNAVTSQDFTIFESDQFSFNIFPQPSAGELQVLLNMPYNQQLDLIIYDINGRLIKQVNPIKLLSGMQTVNLTNEISDLKAGNYLLVLSDGNNRISKEFSIMY